jgi:hypothetical protein
VCPLKAAGRITLRSDVFSAVLAEFIYRDQLQLEDSMNRLDLSPERAPHKDTTAVVKQ